ncbi:phage portal protein [Dyadobacter sp. CY261]|uniref:phage portal protein n=1 Tax=Dyadobacter sp. CY261 TaxID=2907203 RepID=UPI001F46F8DD|nr:phage portal protein [Dyadobacter sp. CY261]MCF0074472.1 phage portal protein [Dyadobacter sp. CY261]
MGNLLIDWYNRIVGRSSDSESRNQSGGSASLKDDAALARLLGFDRIYARANSRTAMGISTFFGCVRLIVNLTSSTPIGVFKYLAGGGSEPRPDHQLDYLLSVRPNPQMAPIIAIATMVINFKVHGAAIAKIVRDNNRRPIGIFPIPTQCVNFIEDPNTGVYFFQITINGTNEVLSEDDIIYLKDLSFDGRIGTSVIDWQAAVIKLDALTHKFAENYYEKGTFIGGFLETPLDADDEDAAKEYKKRVIESVSGKDGGLGLAILGPGIKWHPVSRTPLESQLVEIFNKSDKDIAKMFGVPLSLIGDTEKQTSWGTGVEQMFIGLTRTVIMPIAIQFEQEVRYKCFRTDEIKAGYYIKFNFNGLLRGDSTQFSNFVRAMVNSGLYSIDEVRALQEMPPLPDGLGARNMVQGAMVPLELLEYFITSKNKQNISGKTDNSASQ